MKTKKLSLYDALLFGFKTTLDNIGLTIKLLLFFAGAFLVSAAVTGLAGIPFWMKLMPLKDMNGLAAKEAFVNICLANIPMIVFLLFIFIFLLAFASVGITQVCFDLYEKGSSSFGRFFPSLSLTFRVIVAGVLVLLAFLAGFVCFIVPGFWLIFRLIFVPYLIIDDNASIIEAFKKSFAITRGHGWEIVGSFILSAGLSMSKVISFFSMIFSMLFMIHLYKQANSK